MRSNPLLRWQTPAVVSALVHAVYFATARGVSFKHPLIDADYYDALGVALARGEGLPAGPFWQPPLYPALLGLLYSVFSESLWAPRIVQLLLCALACAGVFSLGARLLPDRRWALGASLLLALHGPLLFYDGELLATSVGTFLAFFALWLASSEAVTRARALGAGALVGLAALAVAPLLLMVVPVAWTSRRLAVLAVAAALGVVSVATVINLARTSEVVLISANGGINFFIGNNADVDRAMAIRPGAGWDALVEEPGRSGVSTASEQDRWFYRRGLEWCVSSPAACAGNLLWKARLLFVSRELPRNEDLATVRRQSWVLRALTAGVGPFSLPAGVLWPLALAGLWVAAKRRDRLGWALLLAAVALALPSVIYFPSGRYRLPLAPLQCLLAMMGLHALLMLKGRARVAPAVLAAVGLLLAVWPAHLAVDDIDFDSEMRFAAAGRLIRLGRDGEALSFLEDVLQRHPDHFEAGYDLGLAFVRLGRLEEAVTVWRRVLQHHADDVETRVHLADALLATDHADESEQLYAELERQKPADGEVALGLARARLAQGRVDVDELLQRARAQLGAQDDGVREVERKRDELRARSQ